LCATFSKCVAEFSKCVAEFSNIQQHSATFSNIQQHSATTVSNSQQQSATVSKLIQQNLVIQQHSAVSPKHKTITSPRAMKQKKDVHARAQAQLLDLPGTITKVQ
jgi:Flp pilus assembly protein TadG